MAEKGPRAEVVRGRRAETVEFGLRVARDSISRRKGQVAQMSSLEDAAGCRERPFSAWDGDEQVVTRMIVTYTTDWTVVPGHEGSRHLSCHHNGTPKGYVGEANFGLGSQGPDYQPPHPFRQRDMTPGNDGALRYTCPVCGLAWQFRGPADNPADDAPADAPPAEPLLTLF